MASNLQSIMRIEVPLVVVLGERTMDMKSIRQWVAGSIIELPINAEEDLEIRINQRRIANGSAVKLGENFGVRLTTTLGQTDRIQAMGPDGTAPEPTIAGGQSEMTPDELAEAMLAGQF